MDKRTPIIIVGFGSIGKRHEKNLRAEGFSNIAVFDPNTEATKDFKGAILPELSVQTLSSYRIVFITNPTHLHLKTALMAAKAKCDLFIEKPLSHMLEGVDELKALAKENDLVAMVACNMRFHPAYEAMKASIVRGDIGSVRRVELHFDYYLPFWRPGTDYRQNYAAKKETGGGILLDDIHEFDLLFWFAGFDELLESKIEKGYSGTLEIETEDSAKGSFRFKNGIVGTVSSGYLSKEYKRGARIMGETGTLSFEWNNKVLLEGPGGKKELFDAASVDMNLMYQKELRHFLEAVEKRATPMNPLREAAIVLKTILT